jgi:hypothetical protein
MASSLRCHHGGLDMRLRPSIRPWVVVGVAVGLTGCGSSDGGLPDASPLPDDGGLPDASSLPDSGGLPDASSLPDSGGLPDASSLPDGGATDSASETDGGDGPPDATLPTAWRDTAWVSAASANRSTVDITRYFPTPPVGKARINMFASPTGYYMAEKIWAPEPGAGNRTRIDDYRINTEGTAFAEHMDTWYLYNPRASGGSTVREFLDLFYTEGVLTTTYDMSDGTPFDHGTFTTTVGGSAPNVSSTAHGQLTPGGTWSDVHYDIFIQDVKASIATNVGTLTEVTLQAERQYNSDWDLKYIFYFAPDFGIVGMQALDADWNRVDGFLQVWKTCLVEDTVWVCP